jgi:hypothetical protein
MCAAAPALFRAARGDVAFRVLPVGGPRRLIGRLAALRLVLLVLLVLLAIEVLIAHLILSIAIHVSIALSAALAGGALALLSHHLLS